MSENTSDPDRIERDLDQTRSRLGSHLSELQERLSPGQVIDDVMAYFRGSEGADFGRNLLESVRANPLPAALTGIGVAWLMASNSRPATAAGSTGSSVGYAGRERTAAPASRRVHVYRGPSGSIASSHGDDVAARVRAAELGVTRQTGEAEHAYSARMDEARGKAMGLARQAQESAESFGQRIRDALQSAKQTVAESAGSLRESAGNLRDQASSAASSAAASMGDVAHGASQGISQYAGSAAQSVSGAAQSASDVLARGGRRAGAAGGDLVSSLVESPVLLGALGLAAGAMLGILLPQSEQEEAALGDIAGQARETASGLAQEAADRGGKVAEAVIDAGRESAQSHGLTGNKSAGELTNAALSGDLAGNAKNVAQDVLRAGDEAVRGEAAGRKDKEGPQPK